ncbi:hypothetical protein B0H13DRAFT_1928808 [Mycena leptocephala]|nr:hypothetical protein B0H13DRAFT_1928808 [Mycena leptocephala]
MKVVELDEHYKTCLRKYRALYTANPGVIGIEDFQWIPTIGYPMQTDVKILENQVLINFLDKRWKSAGNARIDASIRLYQLMASEPVGSIEYPARQIPMTAG